MRGDRLIIKEWHIRAAREAASILVPQIRKSQGRFTVSIAGESGSGKSEIAEALAEALSRENIRCLILQQDDYFVYPPKTNENKRREDITWVGPGEVLLDLMDKNLEDIKNGKDEIVKPLVIFEDDRAIEETVSLKGIDVVIVEGTYTTVLQNVDQHIFIDRTYEDTRAARAERAREAQDAFLETVLEIEHDIISAHKARADIIVTRDYEAVPNPAKGE